MNSLEKAKKIGEILDNKKGEDIAILNVSGITSLTDYYVIVTAKNTVHAKTLCDEIEEKLKKCDISPRNIEGYQSAMWILKDYEKVIVHVFYEETRKFYDLERLWGDAQRISIDN